MTPEIWTASEIAAALKLSRRHVAERIVNEPRFPKPIRAGRHVRKRWLAEEIIRWMKNAA